MLILLNSSKKSSEAASLGEEPGRRRERHAEVRELVAASRDACRSDSLFVPPHESSTRVQSLARRGERVGPEEGSTGCRGENKGNLTGHPVTRAPHDDCGSDL